jgi:HEAT repeat protein
LYGVHVQSDHQRLVGGADLGRWDHYDERAGRRVVRGIVNILGELRDPATLRHLGPLLQHADLRVRQETMRALADWGTRDAIAVLGGALEHGDVETRQMVAAHLGAVGSRAAEAALVRALQSRDAGPQEFSVQQEILLALGRGGSPEALPALEAFVRSPLGLVSPKHRALRRAAEEAVIQILARAEGAGEPSDER